MSQVIDFDVKRAVLEDYLDNSLFPAHVEINSSQRLKAALDHGTITPDALMLTFEVENVLYTFPMAMVLCYNVIQGELAPGRPWIMTFCNACNTGMVFDPIVEGKLLHFRRRGAYDGLLLISDLETTSYWHHITGLCMYGENTGRQLRQITTTRQMSAAEALSKSPDALILTTPLTPMQEKLSRAMERMRSAPESESDEIASTMSGEDTRRPRFELGLGLWNDRASMFFPLVTLHLHNNVLITTFDGRRIVVYQTPDSIAPTAAYTTSTTAKWEGDTLRMEGGVIRSDKWIAADGTVHPLERPTQLLMRWYGFAITFPGTLLPPL